jgi:hypothetical protein
VSEALGVEVEALRTRGYSENELVTLCDPSGLVPVVKKVEKSAVSL